MNIVSIEHISKSYGEKVLFRDLTFGIEDGDKIGLIGVNGTGKSTLLKVIAGIEQADEGKVTAGSRISISYLPQNPAFDEDATVLQYVFLGDSPAMAAVRGYEDVMARLDINPGDMALQRRLVEVTQRIDALQAWQLESDAKTILTKLGITDFDAKVTQLSGGQRKRVALANALLHPTDLLILDEPTNHIDNETVNWLEQFLHKRKGALLMITHDRYFLDRVVDRIIELDQGKLYSYTGNYSRFLELKAEREEQTLATEQKRLNLYRNELAWIRRGAKARSTKQKARIDRFEKLKEDKLELRDDQVDISVGSTRLGRKVIELGHIQKSYGQRTLIRDLSYTVTREDRIGIVGPNGQGKSTLLRIIAGRLAPDSGTVDIGQTVKFGCFFQENEEMDESLRVIEYIKEEAQVVRTSDGAMITAEQMLERFLFPPGMQWTPISKLSGGEKRRLYLLRVLIAAPNVLLLDEPTNDLDIQTLTILEQYLDEFQGAVIAVSHDRYFLDRTAEKIIAFEGNGSITHHVGNYSEYKEYAEQRMADGGNGKATVNKPTEDRKSAGEENKKERALKFSFKEQREFEQIDDVIAGVEQKLNGMEQRMNEAASDSVQLQELVKEQQELERQLEQLMERWTYLNELAEQIANQSRKR